MPLDRPFRARRLPMTSLIDIIFLLLLFFMLSTSFTRMTELRIDAAGSGATVRTDDPPRFLQLTPDRVTLNGTEVALDDLAGALQTHDGPVLVALRDGVTAQRLADLLATLRQVAGLDVLVLD